MNAQEIINYIKTSVKRHRKTVCEGKGTGGLR